MEDNDKLMVEVEEAPVRWRHRSEADDVVWLDSSWFIVIVLLLVVMLVVQIVSKIYRKKNINREITKDLILKLEEKLSLVND